MIATLIAAVALLVVIGILAYHTASAAVWTLTLIASLIVLGVTTNLPGPVTALLWFSTLAFAAIANFKNVRQSLLTAPIFKTYKKILPQMSQT
ncbi:MAG: acyl-CoA dehydrogenase, partial [Betaproteobacteria bacterium]|nr:acyl-CoA dehydrogenase [Betaproteobacteria bacterium]